MKTSQILCSHARSFLCFVSLLLLGFASCLFENDGEHKCAKTDSLTIPCCTTWHVVSFPVYKTPVRNHFNLDRIHFDMAEIIDGALVEMDSTDSILPGKGYWLAGVNEVPLKLADYDEFKEDELTIMLTPGWNLIGNPYPYEIDFPDTNLAFFLHAPDSLVPIRGKMQPWRGYYVQVDSPGTLITFRRPTCG